MSNTPIQVILNADNLRRDRVTTPPNSNGKDFYEGMDSAFERHKGLLISQVRDVSQMLMKSEHGGVGYAKVVMRASALAKSHRPRQAIFTDKRTRTVGGRRIGEMIVEVTADALQLVQGAIEKAEVTVKIKENKKTAKEYPAPTRARCEVGAIDRFELWGKSDRRQFNVKEGVEWLSDPQTGQFYQVELFEHIPTQDDLRPIKEEKKKLFVSFEKELRNLGPGLIARIPKNLPDDAIFVEIKLIKDKSKTLIFESADISDVRGQFDPDEERHSKLLGFLETHPLVREILLPSKVVKSATKKAENKGMLSLTKPVNGNRYPKVGVIDGGVSGFLDSWVTYRHSLIAPEHSNFEHGSFIGGLLVSGQSLNPHADLDDDGCLIADINVFPDNAQPTAFADYYPSGTSDFLDELAAVVAQCRKQHGIRIFNFSLNIQSPAQLGRYSLEARRLDKIAEDNDAIIIVSAGNLDQPRPEWPADHGKATAILAAYRNDQLYIPSESIRNISVSAINPNGLTNALDGVLASYSRRGPGLRTGVKPDLCHVGGSGTECPRYGNGLYSVSPDGAVISSCGTSYAAPLVAKMMATLDSQIEGETSRETLMALAIHHAKLPAALNQKAFEGIAQQLVGFGKPQPASAALDGDEHQVTLLFSSHILNDKTLEFTFSWPPSLVSADGKCRGDVKLTLVSSPNLDYQYGEEFVRVNVEASLQQEQKDHRFKSELEPTYVFFTDDEKTSEAGLIDNKFKWSPIKAFGTHIPKGRGCSSNWRLLVSYVARAGEVVPEEGIPVSILLTISDPEKKALVFREMRQSLQASGVQTADIRTAARVTPRI